ncbi:MAG: hypothetical protein WCI11_19800 [Candidatus Methylumidiphilus sp.]
MNSEPQGSKKSFFDAMDEEMQRRMKSAKSPIEAIRGMDDFFRTETARYFFDNPAELSEWNSIRTKSFTEGLNASRTEDDYFNWLVSISARSPLSQGSSDCFEYGLQPPTLKPSSDWKKMVKPYKIHDVTLQRLFNKRGVHLSAVTLLFVIPPWVLGQFSSK